MVLSPEAVTTLLLYVLFLHLALLLRSAEAVFDEIEFEFDQVKADLGKLTLPQSLTVFSITVVFVLLWAYGIIPIDFDMGRRRRKRRKIFGSRPWRGMFREEVEMSTFLLDCPLQFVCEVDAWAHRDHEDLVSNLIASWFRHPNKTWHHENARIYGGASTCRQMYPCPFPVQDVMGIHIPGSPESNHLQEDEDDEDILPLGLF